MGWMDGWMDKWDLEQRNITNSISKSASDPLNPSIDKNYICTLLYLSTSYICTQGRIQTLRALKKKEIPHFPGSVVAL